MKTSESIKSSAFQEMQGIPKIEGGIWSLKFSPDDKFLAIGCEDGLLQFFDISSHTISSTRVQIKDSYNETVSGLISSIAMPAGKEVIIVATRMGFAVLDYNAVNLFNAPLEGWLSPQVKISPDEKIFAVSDDKRIVIYELDGFKKIIELETGGCTIGIEFSNDGKYLFAGGDGGKSIHVWNVNSVFKASEIKAHDGVILDLAIGNDGHLISSAEDFRIKKWDVATGASIPVTGEANGKENQIQFSPDYSVVGTACLSRMLALREPDTLDVIQYIPFTDYCTSLDFSNDGKLLAAADKSGVLRLWKIG